MVPLDHFTALGALVLEGFLHGQIRYSLGNSGNNFSRVQLNPISSICPMMLIQAESNLCKPLLSGVSLLGFSSTVSPCLVTSLMSKHPWFTAGLFANYDPNCNNLASDCLSKLTRDHSK